MKEILATIDRFEGDYAVLRYKDQEILLAKETIPEEAKEGSIVALTVTTQEQTKKSRTDAARELLNDILNDAVRRGIDTRPVSEKLEYQEVEELSKETKQLEKTGKDLGDQKKKLDELGNKLDDLNKKLKG
jgi:hypothetical protein